MDTLQKDNSSMLRIPKDLRILLMLAVVLNILRILVFRSDYLVYILWNIFLAILPFIVSSILLWHSNKSNIKIHFLILGLLLWILLLPNAPYIVTDLIHIGNNHGAPILFDTFLLFSSAWAGLILGMYSIFHIENIFKKRFSKKVANTSVPVIIFFASVGIYIGRYLRFNSWDIFTDARFFGHTFKTLSHSAHFAEAMTFILVCFLFLYMSYRAWKSEKTL